MYVSWTVSPILITYFSVFCKLAKYTHTEDLYKTDPQTDEIEISAKMWEKFDSHFLQMKKKKSKKKNENMCN